MSYENPFAENNNEQTAEDFERMNYYERLGVSPDASQEEIKKSYRKLAHLHHPDHDAEGMGDDGAIMRTIAEAYEYLGDVEKRQRYDRKTFTSSSTRPSSPDAGYQGAYNEWANSYRQEKPSQDMEAIKAEAVRKATQGVNGYKTYIQKLAEQGIEGAEDLVNSPEVQTAILKNAMDQLYIGMHYYHSYLQGWVNHTNFDKKKFSSEPQVAAAIEGGFLRAAQQGPYHFRTYLEDAEKYIGITRQGILSNPKILEIIKTNAQRKVLEGAHYYKGFITDWSALGFNPDVFNQDDTIRGIVQSQAKREKDNGEKYYRHFVEQWSRAGIPVE